MDEAAPAAAGPAVEKKRPLLRRVPTTLVVTLLGITLTAWLLPAFTRQWDDRQKAHDFKAAVAAELASATSRALVQSRDAERQSPHFHYVKGCPGCVEMVGQAKAISDRLDDSWLVDRVRIESRLRAYFSQDVLVGWRRYENTIRVLFLLAMTGGTSNRAAAAATSKPLGIPVRQLRTDLTNIREARIKHIPYEGEKAFTDIVNGVLHKQNELARLILASHVTGYSTTTHDLLHDLIPF